MGDLKEIYVKALSQDRLFLMEMGSVSNPFLRLIKI